MATKSNKVLSTQDYEMTLDEVGEAGVAQFEIKPLGGQGESGGG